MLDKIKIKLIVIFSVIAIISFFTILLTWIGVSVWWLLSGYMVDRTMFLYIYLTLTTIPIVILGMGMAKESKK
jgi:hypothetical protein|tara:strand:+ start:1903 stop:2121 length:219 start_codon:yes stop_codon:yes gene_type:complete